MKKNTVALAVAAAMTASLLVGCGGTAADSTSTAESTATSTDAASAATTTAGGDETLTVWAWDPNFNIYALKQAEAIYQKDHPNFKLDIQENTYNDIETKLITAATSGDYSTLPDVFLMQDYSFHKYIANFPDVLRTSRIPALISLSSPKVSWQTPLRMVSIMAYRSTMVQLSWLSVLT